MNYMMNNEKIVEHNRQMAKCEAKGHNVWYEEHPTIDDQWEIGCYTCEPAWDKLLNLFKYLPKQIRKIAPYI